MAATCKTVTGSKYDRLFQNAVNTLWTSWGGPVTATRCGEHFYRDTWWPSTSFTLVSAQNEDIPADTIRRMVQDGFLFVQQHTGEMF